MRYVTLSSQTERGQRYALRLLPTDRHSTLVEPVSFNPLLSVWLCLNCVGIR